jgi:hypothetical protein
MGQADVSVPMHQSIILSAFAAYFWGGDRGKRQENKICILATLKARYRGWVWWCTPVILVTREVRIGRIMV